MPCAFFSGERTAARADDGGAGDAAGPRRRDAGAASGVRGGRDAEETKRKKTREREQFKDASLHLLKDSK